jgi:ketosteroid isomerase-like protein
MSQENVEIVRAAYGVFNRGEIDALLDLCTPDIEWQDVGSLDTRAVVGKDAVRAYFETVMEPWEDVRREPEEITDLGGDQVLALIHLTARGKGSGIKVGARQADLLTIREGKLARWAAYPERSRALEAAGLSE